MKMLTVSLVCAVMALAAADENSTEIRNGFACPRSMTGHCYRLFPDPLPWAEAEKHCVSLKANLESEHHLPHFRSNFWIGGSDCQQDDVWLWSNGKEFSKTNWCRHGAPGYGHGCILVISAVEIERTCWRPEACSEPNPYACGYDF